MEYKDSDIVDDERIVAQESHSDISSILNLPMRAKIRTNRDDCCFKSEYVQLAPYRIRSIKVFMAGMSVFDRVDYVIRLVFHMVSGRWFCNNLVDGMEHTNPGDAYDRLLGEWSTMGIVSALTLSFGELILMFILRCFIDMFHIMKCALHKRSRMHPKHT